jgi:hypothetical protein
VENTIADIDQIPETPELRRDGNMSDPATLMPRHFLERVEARASA